MIAPADLRSLLKNAKGPDNKFTARCPAHDDRQNSLSVSVGNTGSTLIKCFAGCKTEDICAALGVSIADLCADKGMPPRTVKTKPEAIYNYCTADGTVLYRKVRKPGKVIYHEILDARGDWVAGKLDTVHGRPLYRLPETIAAIEAGHRVYLSESEKDADRVNEAGFVCCSTGGAKGWKHEHAVILKNARDLIVLVHKDKAGREFARDVRADCPHARCIELPDCQKDAADYLARHTPDQFLATVDQVLTEPEPEWLTKIEAEPSDDTPEPDGTTEPLTPERARILEIAGALQCLARDPEADAGEIRAVVGDALSSLSETAPAPPWRWTDILAAEDVPDPLFRNGPTPGNLGLLFGESAVGKSYFALSLALSISLGRTLLSTFAPNGAGPVVYLAFEDRGPLIRWRLRAIAVAFGIAWSEVQTALETGLLRFRCDLPGALFEQETRGAQPTPTALWGAFSEQVRAEHPRLIVADPFSAVAMLEEENAARPIHAVAVALSDLAEETGAVALVLHHTSKQRASEGSQHAGRGSSALAARARWIANLTPVRGKENEVNDVVELSVSKNTFDRPCDPLWLRRGDGGVLTETTRLTGATTSLETLTAAVVAWLSEHPNKVVSVSAIARSHGDSADLFREMKTRLGTTKDGLKNAIRAGLESGELGEEASEIRGGRIFRLVPADPEGMK